MRHLRRGVLAVAAMLFALSPDTARPIPLTRDVVASTADGVSTLPNVTLFRFGEGDEGLPFIGVDAGGGILFQGAGNVSDGVGGIQQFSGIFSVAAGTSDVITRVTSGQAAPGGGTFRSISGFANNGGSDVAFFADLNASAPPFSGIFGLNNSGVVSQVAANEFIERESLVGVTTTGDVIFSGSVDSDLTTAGVFKRSVDGGDVQTIVDTNSAVPDLADSHFRDQFNVRTNTDGDLAFLSSVEFDSGIVFNDAVFHTRNGVTRFAGYNSGPPPNPDDGIFWEPLDAFIAPSGDLVVFATLDTEENFRPEFSVWYGSEPADLQLITTAGRSLSASTAFGPDGTLFFSAVLNNTDTFLSYSPGDATAEILIDSDTTEATTSIGRLFGFDPIGVTSDGAVIFFAGSNAARDGYYALETDGTLTALVREGDTIDGQTVSTLTNPANGLSAFNGQTLAVVSDGPADRILRIVFESEAPTNFAWTGACSTTNWHEAEPCTSTNWIGPAGERVTAPPGDALAGDEDATIDNATVRIVDRRVTLDTLTATGTLELIDRLTLNGTSSIANLRMASSGVLISSGETTLTGDEGLLNGRIETPGDGVVINEGTVEIASPIVFLEGVFRNRGTVNQPGIFDVTGRVENKNIWNLDSGDLQELTPGGGSFVNDGTLVNVSGESGVAMFYGGGNGSKIQAREPIAA